jgi:hypothetical protein
MANNTNVKPSGTNLRQVVPAITVQQIGIGVQRLNHLAWVRRFAQFCSGVYPFASGISGQTNVGKYLRYIQTSLIDIPVRGRTYLGRYIDRRRQDNST